MCKLFFYFIHEKADWPKPDKKAFLAEFPLGQLEKMPECSKWGEPITPADLITNYNQESNSRTMLLSYFVGQRTDILINILFNFYNSYIWLIFLFF
jgi:hypothetical protein